MARGMMTSSNRSWEAECDARTLADAKVIQKDPKRMAAAKKAAAKMATDKMNEAKAIKAIAGKVAPKMKGGKK